MQWAIDLGRPGTVIVVDNIVRNGRILDPAADDQQALAVREMLEMMGAHPRSGHRGDSDRRHSRAGTGSRWRWSRSEPPVALRRSGYSAPHVDGRAGASRRRPKRHGGSLVDLDAWPQWGLSVQRAELSSGTELTLGSVGKVWTPVGVALPFEITEFDDGRAWEWKVAGVPATRHEVLPDGDGAVLNFGVPWWAPAYLPVLAVALPKIEQLARAGTAS